MRKIIYTFCVLLTAGGLYLYAQDKAPATPGSNAPAQPQSDAAQWLTNNAEASAKAKAEGKYLLLNFTGSDWCPPCIMMKREVYSTPEFAAFAKKHLVLNELDFPRRKKQDEALRKQNEQLAGEYRIEGLPTLILLSPEGKLIKRYVGHQGDASSFIATLEKAIQGKQ